MEPESGAVTGTYVAPSGVEDDDLVSARRRSDELEVETVGARRAAVEARRRSRRRRRALVIVLVVLAVPIIAGAFALRWWQNELDPGGRPGAPVAFTIGTGWGVSHIGDALEHNGVIGSSLAFQIYARVGGHSKYEAGRYTLHQHIGVRAAVQVLEHGPLPTDRVLRIVPGLWLDQIAAQVHTQLGLDAQAFVKAVRSDAVRSKYEPASVHSVEGLLYPDTYRIAQHATVVDVIRIMVTHFDAMADSTDLSAAALAQHRTPYQVVVVASLIQREAKLDVDRPLIASVIDNRIAQDMRLQIDATSLYAQRFHAPAYDTYKVDGLPPGPIASPTSVSLSAAEHPAQTTYVYYVLSNADGKHAFSSTYGQFLKDKDAAQKAGLLG